MRFLGISDILILPASAVLHAQIFCMYIACTFNATNQFVLISISKNLKQFSFLISFKPQYFAEGDSSFAMLYVQAQQC